jgi:hypothetical protein
MSPTEVIWPGEITDHAEFQETGQFCRQVKPRPGKAHVWVFRN